MRPLPKLNVLVAFPYFSQGIRRYLSRLDPESFRLIIDSGAFTAWNTGQTITMQAYTNFLRTIPAEWDFRAVQLDVYGNPEATYQNWLQMLDMGWRDVMPVFTRGDEPARLDEFYKVVDCIMFGGIAFGGENKNYIKWFAEINKDRPAHWLGFVNMPFIKRYKPTSVDSSAITGAQRYGSIAYYTGGGQLSTIDKLSFQSTPPTDFVDSCQRLGFTMKEILQLGYRQAWIGSVHPPSKESLRGFASFVSHCHHVYRAVMVEKHIGTKVYIACATELNLAGPFDALRFMRSRGVL